MAFAASIFLPIAWAKVQLAAFDQAHPAPACGMPVLAIFCLAILGSGVLSCGAATLSLAALRRMPPPRSGFRKAELTLLAMPALLAMVVLALVLAGG